MRQASEARTFFKMNKLVCEQSEQALPRSYQNLVRSANFLLVNIIIIIIAKLSPNPTPPAHTVGRQVGRIRQQVVAKSIKLKQVAARGSKWQQVAASGSKMQQKAAIAVSGIKC